MMKQNFVLEENIFAALKRLGMEKEANNLEENIFAALKRLGMKKAANKGVS